MRAHVRRPLPGFALGILVAAAAALPLACGGGATELAQTGSGAAGGGGAAGAGGQTLACGAATPPGPIAKIATNPGSPAFGPCGHLAFRSDSALTLLEPDLVTSHALTKKAGSFGFATHSLHLGFVDREPAPGLLRVRELSGGAEVTAPVDVGEAFGFLQAAVAGDALVALCDQGTLGILESGSNKPVDPATCFSLQGSPHAAMLVYGAPDHTLRFFDGRSGQRGVVPGVDLWQNQTDAAGKQRRDFVHLSPDGTVLLYQRATYEPSGDTFVLKAAPTAQLFRVPAGTPIGEVPAGPQGDFVQGGESIYRLAESDGHTLAFLETGAKNTHVVDPAFGLRVIPGARPEHVYRDGTRLLVRAATAKGGGDLTQVDLPTSASKPITSGLQVEAARVSDGETAIAIAHFTKKCIKYPDNPSTCHTQIWGLARYTEAGGLLQLAEASQPVSVAWVGDDGSMLVTGRLFDGPAPDSAPSGSEPASRTYLLGPDGARLRTWDGDLRRAWGAGGTVFVAWWTSKKVVLEAVSAKGGEPVTVAEGFDIRLGLDERKERVFLVVTPPTDAGLPDELWAGRVPSL